jgi:hypothetical protein
VFLILNTIPKRKTAPVRKKLIPGITKNNKSDIMRSKLSVQ